MDDLLRQMPWSWKSGETVEPLVEREWLVTNGLGGYASGTIAGVCTRRYHGYLIAALPAPLGRMMMLNHLIEQVRLPDHRTVWIRRGRRHRRLALICTVSIICKNFAWKPACLCGVTESTITSWKNAS